MVSKQLRKAKNHKNDKNNSFDFPLSIKTVKQKNGCFRKCFVLSEKTWMKIILTLHATAHRFRINAAQLFNLIFEKFYKHFILFIRETLRYQPEDSERILTGYYDFPWCSLFVVLCSLFVFVITLSCPPHDFSERLKICNVLL